MDTELTPIHDERPRTAGRSTSGLVAVALGAATSAFVVASALAGHQFGLVDVVAVLAMAGLILTLNLRQVPQRPLLHKLPEQWNREVVIDAPRAAQGHPGITGTGHAA